MIYINRKENPREDPAVWVLGSAVQWGIHTWVCVSCLQGGPDSGGCGHSHSCLLSREEHAPVLGQAQISVFPSVLLALTLTFLPLEFPGR